ncbi:MAG: hypothetical protein HYU67_09710 [Flavobacteriia bacterium]|nr:hypothetical protein [Flavobacteriia bacterium]
MELKEIHKQCHEIFKKGFFELYSDDDETEEFIGMSKACKIYDKLTEAEDENILRHDCIGENFNQLILRVDVEWFGGYTPQSNNLDYYFFNYFLLLYLFVERVDLIFHVINADGKSKLFNDYRHHNFPTLLKINKWSNFIKHPKEFLFTHWPKFYIKGLTSFDLKDSDVKIDTNFIMDHYMSEQKPRPMILENNTNVYVEIPNLAEITKDFCNEMNKFFDFICSNQVVADFLKKKSTVEHYFENQDFDFHESE